MGGEGEGKEEEGVDAALGVVMVVASKEAVTAAAAATEAGLGSVCELLRVWLGVALTAGESKDTAGDVSACATAAVGVVRVRPGIGRDTGVTGGNTPLALEGVEAEEDEAEEGGGVWGRRAEEVEPVAGAAADAEAEAEAGDGCGGASSSVGVSSR